MKLAEMQEMSEAEIEKLLEGLSAADSECLMDGLLAEMHAVWQNAASAVLTAATFDGGRDDVPDERKIGHMTIHRDRAVAKRRLATAVKMQRAAGRLLHALLPKAG